MTECEKPSWPGLSDKRFDQLAVILISTATVFAAVITLLQSDASARSSRATRSAQLYAIQAMGQRISGQAQVEYDRYAYQTWRGLEAQARSAQSDTMAAGRYAALRDRIAQLSPMLAPPYFDPAARASPSLAAYESDTYYVQWVVLTERYAAAGELMNAWSNKANAYITHLALLAVSLFLYGLATTLAGWTRMLFLFAGTLIMLAVLVWVLTVSLSALPALDDGAIDAYARGMGWAHQGATDKAIAAFDQALAREPAYANALFQRGAAHFEARNFEAAVADYEAARAAGRDDIYVLSELGWTYYLMGRYQDAIRVDEYALTLDENHLKIQFNLALALLASGQSEAAQARYAQALEMASRQVAQARTANQQPPASLWQYLDAGARDLESLTDQLSGRPHVWTLAPPPQSVAEPERALAAAQDLLSRLKSWSVALEFTGQPPTGQLTARIGHLDFAEPVYGQGGELVGQIAAQSFPNDTNLILVLFGYEGMRDGQTVIWKLFHNGNEVPQWRLEEKWQLGEAGQAVKPFSLAYGNVYRFDPGDYVIEMYIDSHLAQRGTFSIASEGGQPTLAGASTAAPVAEPTQLVRFDDARQVFGVDYPAELDLIRPLEQAGSYGYTFSSASYSATLTIAFSIVDDDSLSDRAWRRLAKATGAAILEELSRLYQGQFAETARQEGEEGEHTLHLEASSDQPGLQAIVWLEELEGILARLVYVIPTEQWAARQSLVGDSLRSFSWSAGAAREVIDAQAAAESNLAERSTPAIATAQPTPVVAILTAAATATLTPSRLAPGTEQPQTVQPNRLAEFSDPQGVFSLKYPVELVNIRPFEPPGYGYGLATADQTFYIAILFELAADRALSQQAWLEAAEDSVAGVVADFSGGGHEIARTFPRPGQHRLLVEIRSENQQAHGLLLVSESEGVMALALAKTPEADWAAWSERMRAALDSFGWTADRARLALADAQVTPTPASATAAPTPIPQAWLPPPGKARLILVNDSGVDVLFSMAGEQFEIKAHGRMIALFDPGVYSYSGRAPGFPPYVAKCALSADCVYEWRTDDRNWGVCQQIYP